MYGCIFQCFCTHRSIILKIFRKKHFWNIYFRPSISTRNNYFVLAMSNINAILTRRKKNLNFFYASNCFKWTTGGTMRGERVKLKNYTRSYNYSRDFVRVFLGTSFYIIQWNCECSLNLSYRFVQQKERLQETVADRRSDKQNYVNAGNIKCFVV